MDMPSFLADYWDPFMTPSLLTSDSGLDSDPIEPLMNSTDSRGNNFDGIHVLITSR